MTEIILVRIGETKANLEEVLTNNSHLNQTGIKQAEDVAVELTRKLVIEEKKKLSAIYCSEHNPSRESADIIAKHFDLEPTVMANFNELSWGEWEGKKFAEIEKEKNDYFNGITRRIPRGERIESAVDRLMKGIDAVGEDYPDATLCIVGHGASTRILVAHLLGMSCYNFFRLPCKNGCVTIFKYKSSGVIFWDAILSGGGLDCGVKSK